MGHLAVSDGLCNRLRVLHNHLCPSRSCHPDGHYNGGTIDSSWKF